MGSPEGLPCGPADCRLSCGIVRGVRVLVLASFLAAPFLMIGFVPQSPTANLPLFGYQIVRVYPHDPEAFTQGLQYLDGVLYEGTGLNGRSSIRRVALETGKVE